MSLEIGLCFELLRGRTGVMFDVGAMYGGSFTHFAHQGWSVHAFEPDPDHFAVLNYNWPGNCDVTLVNKAVSNWNGYDWWHTAPDVSPGIGTLTPFHLAHKRTTEVEVTTLDRYCREANVSPDFLKVDAEGDDYNVLTGYTGSSPRVIMVEYSEAHGVGFDDLASFLSDWGYNLIVSRYSDAGVYGVPHTIDSYGYYPCKPGAWGNIIAVKRGE